jgi:DNA-binding MarR family transcriptional regulator
MNGMATETDRKLIDSLERLGEAFQALKGQVARENGLSTLQVRVLLHLMERDEEGWNNSSLAREFGLTRATMGGTMQTLEEKGLVERLPSEEDRRSYTLHLSEKGRATSERMSGYEGAFQAPLDRMGQTEKEALIRSVHGIIEGLIRSDVVNVQRMCYTCRFFRAERGKGYCELLDLVMEEPRLNCRTHETAKEPLL